VNAVRLTRGKGSLSWPTISVNESKNSVGKSQEHRNSIPLGTMAVMQSWPTATATNRVRNEETMAKCAAFWKRNANQNTVPLYLEEVVLREEQHGQAAPANPSTDGSRQGLLDQSQRNWQTFAHGTHNRGETPHRQVVKALVNGDKAKTQCLTVDQVFAEEIKGTNRQGLWRTPSVAEEKNQNTSTQIYLQNQVGATPKAWATPIMGDSHLASTPEVAQKRIEEGKVTLSRQNPGKLNPRWVETLQGVCMGWTSPSCQASVIKNWPKFVSGWCAVTIAQTSYASSATESCLPPQSELLEF
jgi:hypothetical protein